METSSMIYIVSEYASQGEIFGEYFSVCISIYRRALHDDDVRRLLSRRGAIRIVFSVYTLYNWITNYLVCSGVDSTFTISIVNVLFVFTILGKFIQKVCDWYVHTISIESAVFHYTYIVKVRDVKLLYGALKCTQYAIMIIEFYSFYDTSLIL
jgi:hypothetical protein